MRRFLLLSSTNPHNLLLTLDMLATPEIRYRGDFKLIGQQQRDVSALPEDSTLLCLCENNGEIYRPEGNGDVTKLGNIVFHFAGKDIFKKLDAQDPKRITFSTGTPTLLRRCLTEAGYRADAVERSLTTGLIEVDVLSLSKILIEGFRIVADRSLTATAQSRPVTIADILSPIGLYRHETAA